GEKRGELEPAEDARQGIREPDLDEGGKPAGADRAGEVELLDLDRAQAERRIDHDWKEREQEDDHDRRETAVAEPNEEERRDRELRDHLRADENRVEGPSKQPERDDPDGDHEADAGCEQEAVDDALERRPEAGAGLVE